MNKIRFFTIKNLSLMFFICLLFVLYKNPIVAECPGGGGAPCAYKCCKSWSCWPLVCVCEREGTCWSSFKGGGGDDDDCTPVACKDCVPTTPEGYTAIDNGCSLTTANTCTGDNGCKKSCTITKTFWFVETNLTPESQPTSLSMIVDGENYSLSLNSATPATVKYPSTVNNVQTSLPTRVTPPTASGLGYAFRANNYGINNQWLPFDCANAEDYCVESTNNIQNFTPSSLTIPQVLKENAEGKISGMYYTVNKCDMNKIYSLPLETYYKVDNEPGVDVDVCDWDPSLLASDPDCEDPQTGDPEDVCPMLPDEQCTKEEFLPELGEEDSTSFKGCKTEEYTGTEVNNPLKIRVGSKDVDGNNQIKGTVVWFSKSNTTPELPNIVSNYTSSSTDELGIMILQDDNSWSNTPLVYAINSDNTWALIPDGTLRNSSLDSIARVSDVVVTQGSEIITFEFNLELMTNHTGMLSGMYNFKNTVLDQYMLLSDGRVDISHMQTYFNWGIDLVAPGMIDLSQRVLGPQELYLNWNVDGTGSKITDAVINGYRDGALLPDNISLINPSGQNPITPSIIPPVSEIGLLDDINSWKFSSIGITPYTSTDSTRVFIGLNEGGSIILYLTAFDQGCNDNLREHNIDLRPWIATKSGIVYSQGGVGSNRDPLTEGQEQALSSVLKRVLGNELDIGTELVSSRASSINNLIHPELGGVRAINTYDSNDRKSYWYEYFKKKLEVQRAGLTEFVIAPEVDRKVTDKCSAKDCLMYSEENIEIPSGYTCDRNTLFMSEKNIIINPDIVTSEVGIEGCIFIAKGNIEIKGGEYKSGETEVQYDYIDGSLMAENQIYIRDEDAFHIVRDGLEVHGGVVSFGRDAIGSSAIVIERNLRLYNLSHPTFVISWDLRYAKLSEIFFGTEASLYKQEVGFKAY